MFAAAAYETTTRSVQPRIYLPPLHDAPLHLFFTRSPAHPWTRSTVPESGAPAPASCSPARMGKSSVTSARRAAWPDLQPKCTADSFPSDLLREHLLPARTMSPVRRPGSSAILFRCPATVGTGNFAPEYPWTTTYSPSSTLAAVTGHMRRTPLCCHRLGLRLNDALRVPR